MNAASAEVALTPVRWLPAYIGVGSNLADPEAQVRRAIQALDRLPRSRLIVSSPLYRTRPLGEVVQPSFVNAVAGLLTESTPEELLTALRNLERELEERATETLTLPHAGIAMRDFVLYPLADVAPDLDVPRLGRVAALRDRVANRGIEQL